MPLTRKRSSKTKLPSLSHFARQANPFDTRDSLLKRLTLETSESKHLEWKVTPPFGSGVTRKIKCRVIKALVSFANTDGGLIVFGVDPAGKWAGFTERELENTDPAMIAELLSEYVTPELSGVNYGILRRQRRRFPTLHVPPSVSMPHVISKEVVEKQADGRTAVYLQKHAVYCRYQGKSDLATASQYARIIAQRTEMLRSELLRRVKEVEIPPMPTSKRQVLQPHRSRVAAYVGQECAGNAHNTRLNRSIRTAGA